MAPRTTPFYIIEKKHTMDERLMVLETKVKELETYIADLTQTQNQTVALLQEFINKCSTNFLDVQEGFEAVYKKLQ